MASDGDVMEGCIPATPDKERELWEKEIVKILQDTENGFGMSEVEALYSAFQNVNHFKEC